MDAGLIELVIIAATLVVAFLVGGFIERRHIQSLNQREQETLGQPVVSDQPLPTDKPIHTTTLIMGNAVLGIDYFKHFLFGLRNLFGGNVSALESVLDRARREAILRLKERAQGADYIMNVRLHTITLNRRQVEAIAYGTAVYASTSGAVQTNTI